MGYGDTGGEESDQSNADSEPIQAHHRRRGSQASMDLREPSICVINIFDRKFNRISFFIQSLLDPQQRERVASVVHRQETVDCLKKFNARRKLKVNHRSLRR